MNETRAEMDAVIEQAVTNRKRGLYYTLAEELGIASELAERLAQLHKQLAARAYALYPPPKY